MFWHVLSAQQYRRKRATVLSILLHNLSVAEPSDYSMLHFLLNSNAKVKHNIRTIAYVLHSLMSDQANANAIAVKL